MLGDGDADGEEQAKTPDAGAVAQESPPVSVEPSPAPLDSLLADMVTALQDVRGVLVKAVEGFPLDRTPSVAIAVPDVSEPEGESN
jgi:hypothetical protein